MKLIQNWISLPRQSSARALRCIRNWGPGLNEKIYEGALCYELELRHIAYQQQVPMPVLNKGKMVGETQIDLLVDGRVIVELKACEELNSVYRGQLICYLSIMKMKVGLLVNFNVAILIDGVKRVVVTQ